MPRQKTNIPLQPNYQKAVKYYHHYLLNLGYNPRSSRNAQNTIEHFLSYLQQQGITEIQDIQTRHIRQYQTHLQQKPSPHNPGTLHPKTIRSHLRYIEKFFAQQDHPYNPFDEFVYHYQTHPEKERTVLSQAEIQLLYHHTQNELERAVLSLAYGCGLRADELEKLNIQDLHFKDHHLIVKQGKGNKRRVVPLVGKVSQYLKNYLHVRLQENVKTHSFLLNQKQRRLRKYSANTLLKKLIDRTPNKELRAKEISLHTLRHSIATHLLE